MLAAGGFDLGLLLDGDADRAGAADEQGTFLHQLEVTSLLMYYLAEYRGMRDPVVVSVNNTSTAANLGRIYGVETYEVPVGFKFIGPKMIETGAMLGAEESGGFGFGMHLPERDGIYADLCLLDLFLRERERGRTPVSRRWRPSTSSPGRRSIAGSTSTSTGPLTTPSSSGSSSASASRRRPTWAVEPIARTQWLDTGDGVKWFLADGSWLLVARVGPSRSCASTRRRPPRPCATSWSSPVSDWSRGAVTRARAADD